jgi:hypothetical protein
MSHLSLINESCIHSDHSKEKTAEFDHIALILTQGLLMDAGSLAFKAMKSGDIATILCGFTKLGYTALEALSQQGIKEVEPKTENYQAFDLLAITQLISEKIYHCSFGENRHYCELYYLCEDLARGFLNADFDKAFKCYHQWHINNRNKTNNVVNKSFQPSEQPDLADCLYE